MSIQHQITAASSKKTNGVDTILQTTILNATQHTPAHTLNIFHEQIETLLNVALTERMLELERLGSARKEICAACCRGLIYAALNHGTEARNMKMSLLAYRRNELNF
ncbi:hypothetical protein ACJJTC_019484 [Scirpophaga incertulas]